MHACHNKTDESQQINNTKDIMYDVLRICFQLYWIIGEVIICNSSDFDDFAIFYITG